MTFSEYLQKKGYSQTYLADNLRIMRQFIAWTQKEQMSDAEHSRTVDVMAWIKELRNTTEPSTASKYMVSLKHWFDWLVDQGTIMNNPAHIIHIRPDKKQKLYDQLPWDRLEALYELFPAETLSQKRNRVILGLVIYQGLRSVELAEIKPDQLDLRGGRIELNSGRKYNGRELKLQAVQVMDLADYLHNVRPELIRLRGLDSDQLLLSTGKSERISNLLAQFKRQLRACYGEPVTIEHIRNTVVSRWVKSYSLRVAQDMAGHRYVGTTEAYQENNLDDLREDLNSCFPL